MSEWTTTKATGMSSGIYLGDEDEDPRGVLAVSAWVHPEDYRPGIEIGVELELSIRQVAQLAVWARRLDPEAWFEAENELRREERRDS